MRFTEHKRKLLANTGGLATIANVTVVPTSASNGLTPGGGVALSGNFNSVNAGSASVSSVTATIDTFGLQADNSKGITVPITYSAT
jgi:hypothetical protein